MPAPIPASIRSLAKRPAFAAIALAVVALGVALATTAAAIVNALIFQPIPVENLDRVYRAHSSVYDGVATPPDARDLFERTQAKVFSYKHRFSVEYQLQPNSGFIAICELQGDPFSILDWEAAQGRLLTSDDFKEGSEPVTLVSYHFWQNELAGRENIVGESVLLNNKPFRIVGVLEQGKDRVHRTIRPAFWTPLVHTFDHWIYNNTASHNQTVLARLGPDQTAASFQTELDQVDEYLKSKYTEVTGKRDFKAIPEQQAAFQANGDLIQQSYLIIGLVALLLLIACFNLGNMLLSNAYRREREFAIRRSLGAAPRQILKQLLAESLFVSIVGGAIGVALSIWLTRLADELPFTRYVNVELDRTAILVAVLATLFTGLASGLIPAFHLARGYAADSLKRGSKTATVAFSTKILVVAQVALSATLLTSSLLYHKAIERGLEFDPGYDADKLAYFEVSLQSIRNNRRLQTSESIRARLEKLPGVESASFSTLRPLRGYGRTDVLPLGSSYEAAEGDPQVEYMMSSRGFLDTAGIPILQGRDFQEGEGGWPFRVAIVNQSMAERYWPGESAIGREFFPWGAEDKSRARIVGVYRDFPRAPWSSPAPQFMIYQSNSRINFFLRAEGHPHSLLTSLQGFARDPSNNFLTRDIHFLADAQERAFSNESSARIVLGALAISALILSSVGIWYTTRQYVRQSRKELSIRLAIGASPGSLLSLTLKRSISLTATGLILGAGFSFVISYWIQSILQGISASELTPYIQMIVALSIVALASAYFPARSALKADPREALAEV